MSLEVVKPGLYSTIQDHGREGNAQHGIPKGGVMDVDSYELVNTLLRNDHNEPVIEATLLGPTIRFLKPSSIAITGSDLSPMINKTPIELNRVHQVNAGDILSFGRLKYGCRCYIGISGIWDVLTWLGSCSPLTYGNVLSDNILKKGSIIKLQAAAMPVSSALTIPHVIDQQDTHELSISEAPEYDWFREEVIHQLTSTTYSVSNNSNRMGYRLTGETLELTSNSSMISSGVLPGTVQITKEGTPIILLQDAQTTGGYPRIGILDHQALNRMAHIKPGDRVRFRFHSVLDTVR